MLSMYTWSIHSSTNFVSVLNALLWQGLHRCNCSEVSVTTAHAVDAMFKRPRMLPCVCMLVNVLPALGMHTCKYQAPAYCLSGPKTPGMLYVPSANISRDWACMACIEA